MTTNVVVPGGSKRLSKTADLFPAGCCIRRPPGLVRDDGRARRPLDNRHKKANAYGVGIVRAKEVLSPQTRNVHFCAQLVKPDRFRASWRGGQRRVLSIGLGNELSGKFVTLLKMVANFVSDLKSPANF